MFFFILTALGEQHGYGLIDSHWISPFNIQVWSVYGKITYPPVNCATQSEKTQFTEFALLINFKSSAYKITHVCLLLNYCCQTANVGI